MSLYLLPLGFLAVTLWFRGWPLEAEGEQIGRLTDSETAHISAEITRKLQYHAETSRRAAERWLLRNPRDQADWDYEMFIRRWLDAELEAVEWVGPDLTVIWHASEGDANLGPQIVPRENLDRAVAEHRVVLSGPVWSTDGTPVSTTAAPIERGTVLAGWVVATYDLSRVLQSALEGGSVGFAIEVLTNDRLLFARYPEQKDLQPEWGRSMTVGYDQLKFDLKVWPNAATLEMFRSPLPRIAFVGGLLGAVVLALAIRLAQVSSLRSSEVQTNVVLQSEAKARRHAEKSLERKLRELARSNREFERFAYVISHDLRDPLNAIALNLQAVLIAPAGELEQEDRRRLEMGNNAVWRLEEMIGCLLSYASAGGGASDALELVDTEEIVEEVIANLQARIGESGATVTRDELPRVIARRSQFTRLLQNLVSNAIKYRGDEPAQVRIEAHKGDDEWIFSVADNGRGMDEQQTERAFDLFWRPVERGDIAGTGIGLAVCQRVVELHGGRIRLESEPGRGTTVFFTLPADPEPLPSSRTPGI